MGFVKRLPNWLLVVLFLVPCVALAAYASDLNGANDLVGWGVGIGAAIVEAAVVMIFVRARTWANLKLPLGMLVVGALPAIYWIAMPLVALQPFKAHVAEYLAAAAAAQPTQENMSQSPVPSAPGPGPGGPVGGKLIPIDVRAREIDRVFFYLSNSTRAKDPQEVAAIAALWWEDRRVGSYGGQGGAYQWQCTVVVSDKETHKLLDARSFVGSEPPPTSRNGVNQWGGKPYKEIAAFLNSLPHR